MWNFQRLLSFFSQKMKWFWSLFAEICKKQFAIEILSFEIKTNKMKSKKAQEQKSTGAKKFYFWRVKFPRHSLLMKPSSNCPRLELCKICDPFWFEGKNYATNKCSVCYFTKFILAYFYFYAQTLIFFVKPNLLRIRT